MAVNRTYYCIAALFAGALAYSQETTADAVHRRYLDLTSSWADVRFTDAERTAMQEGKKWESLMLRGPGDPLGERILASGEPSFESLSIAAASSVRSAWCSRSTITSGTPLPEAGTDFANGARR